MSLSLSDNAIKVLEARYLRRDTAGRIVESPEELFRRVARAVAGAETHFGDPSAAARWEDRFFESLSSLDFLPNSPTLMNAGTPLGQLSACFVLPVEDSMDEIFESLKLMALIQQSGGGTGFSFSHLRPAGDLVASTGGAASGPVSFMRIFDCATENIRQGGKRRGANMGVLRVDHPDVLEFIDAKLDGRSFQNFNLSVAVTDEFMQAAESNLPFRLRHPRTRDAAGTRNAGEVVQRIAQAAWQTGDPGLIFLDAINRANPTPALGTIEATNPCGEVPLLPYEACNLGSINLSRMTRRESFNRKPQASALVAAAVTPDSQACGLRLNEHVESAGTAIDWDKLARTTRLAIRFLDDVIEIGKWPSPRVAALVRANRKVGLGVMGFAEMLILLGIPYASDQAVSLAEEISRFIANEATAASAELAHERGPFPNWPESIFAARGLRLRNATRTSIAPTGTISIIAGTSASIEPLFALAYRHEHVLSGQTLTELNPLFLRYARDHGLHSDALVRELESRGSLVGIAGFPEPTRSLFRTALEIAPDDHLRVQAAFQKHVDNAVSKTINLPHSAPPDDVAAIYRRAWAAGVKGITVYRYGSKDQQILTLGVGETPSELEHFARCDPYSCKL